MESYLFLIMMLLNEEKSFCLPLNAVLCNLEYYTKERARVIVELKLINIQFFLYKIKIQSLLKHFLIKINIHSKVALLQHSHYESAYRS